MSRMFTHARGGCKLGHFQQRSFKSTHCLGRPPLHQKSSPAAKLAAPRRRSRISTADFLKKSRVECSPMSTEVTGVWIPQKITDLSRLITVSARSKCGHGQNWKSDFWRIGWNGASHAHFNNQCSVIRDCVVGGPACENDIVDSPDVIRGDICERRTRNHMINPCCGLPVLGNEAPVSAW